MTTEEKSDTEARGDPAWLLKALLLGRAKLSRQSMKRLDEELKRREKKKMAVKKKRRKTRRFLAKRSRLKHREHHKARHLVYKYTFRGRYAHMKAYVKRRGVEWGISPADWQALWLKVRSATGREEPWAWNDYRFMRVDTTQPFRLGNLLIRTATDTAPVRV